MLKTFDYFSTTIKVRCVIDSKRFHRWMLRIVLRHNWLDLCMIERLHHLSVGDLSSLAQDVRFQSLRWIWKGFCDSDGVGWGSASL